MATRRSASCSIPILLALLLPNTAAGREAQGKDEAFPAGSEKAVQAVRELYPDAAVRAVSAPRGFGADAEDGSALFWVVGFRSKDADHQLNVTPEGVVILLPRTVEAAELPAPVAAALSQETAGAKLLRLEKQEMRATLRYAALAQPAVCYVATLAQSGESKRLEIAPDGRVLHSTSLGNGGESGEEAPPVQDPAAKQAEVPAEAAKAVAAVRAILPRMFFRGVEEVGYLDGIGQMEVLNYEVEFFLDGVAKEWNATPDGIVIQVPTPVEADSLPAPVRATLAQNAGWEIRKLVQEETRAGLKFVPLETPKVVYLAEFERAGKPVKVRFQPDGTRIEEIDPRALLGK